MSNKTRREFEQRGSGNYHRKNEGEVTINYGGAKDKKASKHDDDYVDYEEITD